MSTKIKEVGKVGGFEKWSYAFYFFGQNLIYGLVAFNVQTLFSDVGITVTAVAAILFVTKLWDAINDPILGVFIDKIKFKKGRFLPWIKFSLPFIAASSLIMFLLPNGASLGVKIAWAVISYVVWDMSYTLCDVPIFVLPTSMTDNVVERTSIISVGRYLGIIGIMLTMVLVPMLQGMIGWGGVGVVLSIAAAVFMLPVCFAAKERHIVRSDQGVTLKQMFKYVGGNKFLLIFFGAMFIGNATNFAQTLNMFFARYNLGDQNLASMLGLLMFLPALVVGAIIPFVIKKIDKFHLYFALMIANAAFGLIRYLVGYDNLPVFLTLAAIHGVVTGANGILVFMFTPDCLEYGTYHTGERSEGVAASVQTFVTKLVGSVVGPLAMLFIGAFGFVSGENAVQPQSALNGIWLAISIVPCFGAAICLLLLSRYKLRDKDVQIMVQYNQGKITKEEADAQLSAKYGPAANLSKMTVSHD